MVKEIAKLFESKTKPIKIWSEDEARFGRMSNVRKCWAPKKKRPTVKLQRVREYLYVFAANCIDSGETYSLILPKCNTDAMQLFLEGFSKKYSDYNNIIIVDQASWHVTKKLPYFDNIKFIYLPAGSPELNPTEHFWEHMREKFFGNQIFNSLDQVEEKILQALEFIANDIQTIKSLVGFHWLTNLAC